MPDVLERIKAGIDHSTRSNEGPFFTYIIGNNGSGKSRILRILAEHYSNDAATHIRTVPCISNALYDRFEMRKLNKVEYLGSRSVSNAVFHSTIDRELARYIAIGIATQRNFLRRFTETIDVEISVRFSQVSKQDAWSDTPLISYIDKRKVKNKDIDEILDGNEQKWLMELMPHEVILNRLTRAQARTLKKFLTLNPSASVLIKKSTGEFTFGDLSSGEQNRILLTAKIMSSAKNRSLIIIDEPEISLHLHWQMELHESLKKMVADLKNYHVVIATHSPIVVSEAAKDRISQSIVVLKSAGDTSSVYRTVPEVTNNNTVEPVEFDGMFFKSGHIRSYDGLVLDFFDTATYNMNHVVEEIADAVLKASQQPSAATAAVNDLRALLEKKGISREHASTIKKAIGLIERHLGDKNASFSVGG